MTDIVNFPDRSEREDRREFLQDENETLQFDGCNVKGFFPPDASTSTNTRAYRARERYWSNQELADLFRVKRLLSAAGIACETDHGSTDEGDPWFVFCDGAGEVFIHLCRIDAEYLLDSPSLSAPLRGANFNELIDAFTQRHIGDEAQVSERTGSIENTRVVRFQRNGKVFMHPATMLAALVWTLFLSSEELVMVMPGSAEDEMDAVDGLAREPLKALGSVETPQEEAVDDMTANLLQPRVSGTEKADTEQTVAQFWGELNDNSDSKFNYSTYAFGLSAIAISFGFMSQEQLPDIDTVNLTAILSAIFENEQAEIDDGTQKAYLDVSRQDLDFLAFVQDIIQDLDILPPKTDVAENATTPSEDQAHLASQMLQAQQEDQVDAANGDKLAATKQNADVETARAESSTVPAEQAKADKPGSTMDDAPGAVTSETSEAWFANLALDAVSGDILNNLQAMMIQNTEVQATFEVTESFFNKTNSLISKSTYESGLPLKENDTIDISQAAYKGYARYDEHAQQIVQFIMDNSRDLEIVATQDEVMFFDSAIIEADSDDIVVMAWSLENGDVIAAMGLRSQFEGMDFVV
ncbi:hypothetical protein C6W92_15925 [Roseovarius sp. A46]|uniref:hypothetical protein n=1 Tax=Roseovarius sp. A46 TaxID=2109331 RepID=UPI001012DDB3|nr:hypothetical protein [Roseovarius sp. A46]RXV59035.1 hypothetical protein C6W92_15925 [Roseovarius sp. A46]